jgi:hypothetical protein
MYGEKRKAYRFRWGSVKGRGHSGDLGIDGKVGKNSGLL